LRKLPDSKITAYGYGVDRRDRAGCKIRIELYWK